MNAAGSSEVVDSEVSSSQGTSAFVVPLFALAIIVLGVVVRVVFVPLQSLTWDELYELQNLSPNFSDLVFRSDGFPPLFPILFSGWYQFVTGDNSARWFSVAVGMMALWPIWMLCRSIERDSPAAFDMSANSLPNSSAERSVKHSHIGRVSKAASTSTLSLITIAFICVSPFHNYFSTEGRAYALMLTLSIACVVSGLRAIDSNRMSAWSGFAVAGVLGVYAHYYSVFVLLTVLSILVVERKPFPTWRRALLTGATICIALTPMLWVFPSDFEAQVDYAGYTGFSFVDIGYTYFSYLASFCLGPSLRALHTLPRAEAVATFVPWVFPLGAATLFLLWRASTVLSRRWIFRLCIWGTLPVILSAVATLVLDLNYNVRYTMFAWAPVVVGLSVGVSTLLTSHGWKKLLTAMSIFVLLAAFMISLFNRACVDQYRNADFRAITKQIESKTDKGTTVFVNVWYQQYPLRHYLSDEWLVAAARTGIDDPQKYGNAKALLDSVPLEKPLVLVYSREFHGDVNRRLLAHLESSRTSIFVLRCGGIEAHVFPTRP